ncbi:hypothetical protein C8Q73DRAFT_718461 [Cubamyces lactineus]|nr:hypothetical protein C8Q73DRAFT_718461 [Cubamyces lactineus]
MLATLASVFTRANYPTVVVLVGDGKQYAIAHIVPEDGTKESIFYSAPGPSGRYLKLGSAREETRTQIGTVALHGQEGEHISFLIDDISQRASELWTEVLGSSGVKEESRPDVIDMISQKVLQPAAMEAIEKIEGRPHTTTETETFPVFIVRMNCPKPGRILEFAYKPFGY